LVFIKKQEDLASHKSKLVIMQSAESHVFFFPSQKSKNRSFVLSMTRKGKFTEILEYSLHKICKELYQKSLIGINA